MEYVWAIVLTLIVLGISLYNYFDSRDLNQLTSSVHNNMVFNERNKRYGAYSMRKSYNQVMLFILGGTVFLFAATIGTHYTFARGGNVPNIVKAPEMLDTALLSLNTPPEEEEKTLPPSYSIQSNSGAGGDASSSQEAQKEQQRETPDDVRNPEQPNNQETGSNQQKAEQTHEKPNQKIYTDPRDPEQYRNAGSDAVAAAKARAEERKRKEEERKRQAEQRAAGNNNNGSKGNEGSTPKNQPMVDFALSGRTPYENDIWYVRNPGYTCGKGVAGTVVVNIKVNSGGNVTEAVPNSTAGLDPCLVEKAVEYAKKSRFNASSKALQEGSITYKFKAQ